MKNLLILCFCFFSIGVFGQSISLSDTTVTITGSPSDNDLHSYIQVKNEGVDTIELLWKRTIEDLPDGWISWICDQNNCYVDFVSECPKNKPNVLAPGESFELQIHANPKDVEGTTNISMELFSCDEPDVVLNRVDLTVMASTSTSTSNLSKEAIKVYPNPTVDFFQVNYDEVANVSVYNIVGSKMLEFDAAPQKSYDVSALKEGIYLVRMTDDQNKVIKTVRLSKK